jgi:glycine betaine/choline ABC-type transport system substrate-binding protein
VLNHGQIWGRHSTDEMRKLNYEVDGAKRDKKIVVHEWLVKKGFVTGSSLDR